MKNANGVAVLYIGIQTAISEKKALRFQVNAYLTADDIVDIYDNCNWYWIIVHRNKV